MSPRSVDPELVEGPPLRAHPKIKDFAPISAHSLPFPRSSLATALRSLGDQSRVCYRKGAACCARATRMHRILGRMQICTGLRVRIIRLTPLAPSPPDRRACQAAYPAAFRGPSIRVDSKCLRMSQRCPSLSASSRYLSTIRTSQISKRLEALSMSFYEL